MTQITTVRQILSQPDIGFLPYLNEQLQSGSLSRFKAQFGFQVDECCSQVASNDDSRETLSSLLLTLKLSVIVDSQTSQEEATLHALEFQELIDAQIIEWSQNNEKLLQPISSIKGTFGQVSEIPYHGGYLPGFEIHRQFTLTYTALQPSQTDDSEERSPALYSPGERTPVSGQYELVNPDGKGTGLEVTSTEGHPFPPTRESEQSYKLVDPTKHKA